MKVNTYYLVSAIYCLMSGLVFGQTTHDTLTVFQYNILNYGSSSGFCNSANNNQLAKDGYLKEILKYVKPDVVGFNEINANVFYLDHLNDFVLNKDTLSIDYAGAAFSNNGFSNLVNGFFYNKEKLTLYKQDKIDKDLNGVSLVRVLDVYTLYYNDSLLEEQNDTVFLTFIIAHLKAGNSSADEVDRDKATKALMNYLDGHGEIESAFFMGDFNVQSSNETAFQNLITPANKDIEFADPINKLGSWNNSAAYAAFHTQSTRVSSNTNSGCFSSGGMDDRFDFILCYKNILNDTNRLHYVPSSYKAVGQDGNRLNETVVFPGNNSVPSEIGSALFNLSDHLPVTLKLAVKKLQPDVQPGIREIASHHLRFVNPVSDRLDISLTITTVVRPLLEIRSVTGVKMLQMPMNYSGNDWEVNIDVSNYSNGIYFVRIWAGDQWIVTKMLKQ